jgi:Protein of unknown function (DUF3300)
MLNSELNLFGATHSEKRMIMNPTAHRTGVATRNTLVILLAAMLIVGSTLMQWESARAADAAALIPPDQLDSLVAPIALYPDPLLAQTLAASTYPLEIMQLQQWITKNSGLKDQALVDAVQKQSWDPSIQALAATPEVVKRLADDLQWTTDLGNAFLAQEADVMTAIQRMRAKAVDKKILQSSEQQVVETKVIESKTVVVIEPANPQVVYVPTYSPVVVWGPPVYPYPPIYYPPPPPPGSLALSFGIGLAMGAWWGGGGGGWGCGWGGNNVTINNNNNFIRNTNIGNGNTNIGNGNRWQHRAEHRGGAPYRDRATADRFGGAARGDSLANRQSNARSQLGRQGGNVASGRPSQGAGFGNRGAGAGAGAGAGNRPSQGGGLGNRAGGGINAANRPSAGGADRIGNRDMSRGGGGGGGNRNAFGGGGGGGFNGSSARAAGNRGAASAGSRGRGGGGRRR